MDDQNQTNNPQASSEPPVTPSMPEDITPQTAAPVIPQIPVEPAPQVTPPIMPATPSLPPQPEPVVTPPTEIPQQPSFVPPMPGAETPMPQPEEVAPAIETPTPADETPKEEIPLPEVKKKKASPVILGALALLLVAGVAGAAYYVSNQLSSRVAVAPNAPESKPQASTCDSAKDKYRQCPDGWKGDGSGKDANDCYTCIKIENTSCTGVKTYDYGTYPDDVKHCKYISSGGDDSKCAAITCGPYNYACGAYCFDNTNDCGRKACGKSLIYPACDTTKRDTPASSSITFAKSGTVVPFMKNAFSGTITLSKSGSSDIVIPFATGSAVALKSFTVSAGDVYTITTKISTESKNGYGWVKNQGNTCGPIKTPGDSLDSNSKPTGKCGGSIDISAVLKLASASASLTGITADGNDATVQCWGDAEISDATQDYDYNDFAIVFGYQTTSTIGACSAINIYKKSGDTYGTTALTTAELQQLNVGDVLKFVTSASMSGLSARFRVTVDGVAGDWLTATIASTGSNQYLYSDYTVAKSGSYLFEGQVTTTAQ